MAGKTDEYFLFLTLVLIPYVLSGQKVENLHFEQSGKQIIIYYELVGTQSDQTFDIQVFCSTDGGRTFGSALQKVTGEVGSGVKVGNARRIIWDVLAEREKLAGEIVFEVRVHNSIEFGLLTDERDGEKYRTIKIGSQDWMAEDLNYTKYSIGSSHHCYYPIRRIRSLNPCPTGWHVPDYSEWVILFNSLGGIDVAGGKMKETGILHWTIPNTGATNESGFSALPEGYINGLGLKEKGKSAHFISSDMKTGWELRYDSKTVKKKYYYDSQQVSCSVRCIKN